MRSIPEVRTRLGQVSPNYALQRSWTHELQGRGRLISVLTGYAACVVTGRRASAELGR
jgi:hypothetical protein